MTLDTSIRLLKLAALGSALFGLAMVLALISPLKLVFDTFLDLVHWPLDGQQALAGDSARVLAAITGGLMVGLGALIWRITEDVFAKDPKTGGRIILIGVIAWYLPDSFGSYMVGAGFNVVLNTGFLAMFVLPVLLHRQTIKTALA
ncbi:MULTISPECIES: excinuclease ABC subunit A [unclassified Pseudophaeobacter]|uniref:excinuclease ABC subunit A n=1 Tax=unclassified Pseudophaeobacter TaxID=2637024 RepID=UPI000EFC33F4|nr:excinuclease ABC subunit A [Pseudophaeobacter sp. EL27]